MKIFLSICIVLWAALGSARSWQVGPGGDFVALKPALEAARNGDTLFVMGRGKVYKEGNIIINKSVSVIGVDFPVFDGEKKYEVFTIKSNHVLLSGMSVMRTGYSSISELAGIKMVGVSHVTIRNNRLSDTHFGIYGEFVNNCTISGNELRSNAVNEIMSGNGIHCWKSDKVTIEYNGIYKHRDGIYFEFVTNSVIRFNLSRENLRYGLHFMFSNNNAYYRNIFSNNGAGVAVMYTRGIIMTGNVFSDNWGAAAYGLLLKDISDSQVSGNQFLRNTTGIYMEGSSRIRMKSNNFVRNGWAFKMQANCMDNEVGYSNFMGNTFDVATNGSLSLNDFHHNYWDKYEGYDLDRNGLGDVPFMPVSLFGMMVEKNPPAIMLLRSFLVTVMDRVEKVIPSMIPENLSDKQPAMRPHTL